jgi:hypothetical protein
MNMTGKVSHIIALAQQIQRDSTAIQAQIDQDGLKSPSFDEDFSSTDLQYTDEPAAARARVLEATDELRARLLGPHGMFTDHIVCWLSYDNRSLTQLRSGTDALQTRGI